MPYFDLTVSAVKSVSVLHASYRVAARQARDRGDQDQGAALDARADEIEDALMDSAREAVAWLERHATYTRTGHHSARTGEWRDGDGLVASLFLHHLSRDGDPQLHVHVAIWNRVQRADGADAKWRTLDSRSPAQPAARRRPGRRPDPGDQAVRPRATPWCPGRTATAPRSAGSARTSWTCSPPAPSPSPASWSASPASTRRCTAGRRRGGRCGCCTSRPGRTPAAPRPRPAAPSPGRPARPSPPRRSGSPPGKPRPHDAKCTRCRRCTSRSRRSPPRTPGVHRPCWMMRPGARPRGSRWPRCKSITRSGRWPSSGSRCTGRSQYLRPSIDGEAVVDEVARLAVSGGPAPTSSRSPPRTPPT